MEIIPGHFYRLAMHKFGAGYPIRKVVKVTVRGNEVTSVFVKGVRPDGSLTDGDWWAKEIFLKRAEEDLGEELPNNVQR